MKHIMLSLLALPTLALTGCVERSAADQKLIEACKSAILAFSDEGDSIESVASEVIRDHVKLGKGYRHIALELTITDGFHGRDESHSCVFQEEFSFANMSHNASIYTLDFKGRVIGQENYQIQGTLEEMTKLTGAAEKALR